MRVPQLCEQPRREQRRDAGVNDWKLEVNESMSNDHESRHA